MRLKLRMTNVYDPHEDYSETYNDNFYQTMKTCALELDVKCKGYQSVWLGDFNAVIGKDDSDSYGSTAGKNIKLADFTSDNGNRLLQFCQNRGLQLINTHFSSRRRHEGTHYREKSKKMTRSRLHRNERKISQKHDTKMSSVHWIFPQAGKEERNAWTDHSPVITELNRLTKH